MQTRKQSISEKKESASNAEIDAVSDEIHDRCDSSKKTLARKSFKARMVKRNVNEHLLKCDMCMKSFNRKIFSMMHNAVRYVNRKQYKCGECKKKYIYKKCMKKHVINHIIERAIKCHICSESFYKKYCLKIHIIQHNHYQLFKCDVCKMIFKRKQDLKRHIKQHSA